MRPRWDTDERGDGIADATALVPGAEELLAAMRKPRWVAEDPEAHLLPHLVRACAREGSVLALEGARATSDGSLLVDLRWKGTKRDRQGARAAVYALIGEVAESASYVRQGRDADAILYDVATGMLAADSSFAPHGHILRLRVVGLIR